MNPTKRWIFFLLLSISLPASSFVWADAPQIPGRFSTYVLAMSDSAAFCRGLPDKPECKNGAGMAGMVLHGLWPNQSDDPKHTYQYCSLTQQQMGPNWCSPSIDVRRGMNLFQWRSLSEVMPGISSCLYNHEWYAHGSCSGLNTGIYFETSAALARRFRALPTFSFFMRRAAGHTVPRAAILRALTQDLGPQAESSIVIQCRIDRATKRATFSEINLTLQRNGYWKFPDPSSLARSGPALGPSGMLVKDQGNCPEYGVEIAEPLSADMARKMAEARPPRN